MDFKGQKLSEGLSQWILLIFAVGGFFAGYLSGSFKLMMNCFYAGCIMSFLVAVPDWPWFNLAPLKWIPVSSRPADWLSNPGGGKRASAALPHAPKAAAAGKKKASRRA